jgi:hypothetical protein
MLMSMKIQARVRGDMCAREATQDSHKVPISVDMTLILLANDISTARDTPAAYPARKPGRSSGKLK